MCVPYRLVYRTIYISNFYRNYFRAINVVHVVHCPLLHTDSHVHLNSFEWLSAHSSTHLNFWKNSFAHCRDIFGKLSCENSCNPPSLIILFDILRKTSGWLKTDRIFCHKSNKNTAYTHAFLPDHAPICNVSRLKSFSRTNPKVRYYLDSQTLVRVIAMMVNNTLNFKANRCKVLHHKITYNAREHNVIRVSISI